MVDRGRFEFAEHTADVIIRTSGDHLESAVAAAGEAIYHLITNGSKIVGQKPWRVTITADDLEGLLVGFLTELVLQFDTELTLVSDLEVSLEGSGKLTATGLKTAFSDKLHLSGTAVKGISYHLMEIIPAGNDSQAQVQVLVDI